VFGCLLARLIHSWCVQGWSNREGTAAVGDGKEEYCRACNVQKNCHLGLWFCMFCCTNVDDRLFGLFATTINSTQ
jgi:hypothetical protein